MQCFLCWQKNKEKIDYFTFSEAKTKFMAAVEVSLEEEGWFNF
jgi:hypothetical protein